METCSNFEQLRQKLTAIFDVISPEAIVFIYRSDYITTALLNAISEKMGIKCL
ncbi:hypothetical protein [Microcoleus sp.]|uniref:hypothetical protein n=1 Tax=Microcoleus sp. TaxID=44472 RepID=UPI00403E4B25